MGRATERWAYLGPEGTFTEQAARALAASGAVELDPVGTVSLALDDVRSGRADAACVAMESSVEGAVPAMWSSGDPTLAISGMSFLGPEWGRLEGRLAIAALKASSLSLLDPDSGELTTAPVLQGDAGRLRAVEPSADGSIYVLTDNGADDQILRVSP